MVRPQEVRRKVNEHLAREQARVEAERDSAIESFDFIVAGVQYEGRRVLVEKYSQAGDTVKLAREPSNKHSHNAIQVLRTIDIDRQIGYVPEEDAAELAPLLDAGHPYIAEIKKVLTGGRVPRPVVVVEVFGKDARVSGMEIAGTKEGPDKLRGPSLSVILLGIIFAAIVGYCAVG